MIRIKWYLRTKQVENRVDLYHNSGVANMKRVALKVNKYHKQLWLKLDDTYILNK